MVWVRRGLLAVGRQDFPSGTKLLEVRPLEVRPLEVRPLEVRPLEVRPVRHLRPRVPDLHHRSPYWFGRLGWGVTQEEYCC
jgi:hypothetical protein